MKEEKVFHTIDPVYFKDSKVLILGSMPSVLSRENNFYYAHPQNRFWIVLANVFEEETPKNIKEKKEFLKKHNIALFDVVKSCTIKGSSDSSIKNVEVNDIESIIGKSKITTIYTAGKTAYNLYNKYLKTTIKKDAICLPSTSPANARLTLDKLIEEYSIIKNNI